MNRAGVLNIESAGITQANRAPGFWRRQFQPQATTKQTVFDVLLGVVLPVLCFIFDPIVFRGNMMGRPLFGQLQLLAYSVAFIEIATLIIWLVWRKRLGAHATAVGGFLLTGALISFIIGLAILPFSILGILVVIGILGFTPFLTAFVFWRNGRRAINLYPVGTSRGRKLVAFALGLLFVLCGPSAAQFEISRAAASSLSDILEGDEQNAEAATERLKLLNYLTDTSTDDIVWAYIREQDTLRRARLAHAYMRITGKDIELRSQILLD